MKFIRVSDEHIVNLDQVTYVEEGKFQGQHLMWLGVNSKDSSIDVKDEYKEEFMKQINYTKPLNKRY